nr:immunoglobulin heavy chain junction region [Macaca mulatta]
CVRGWQIRTRRFDSW